ncbi:MAG: acyl carrier protein, partial [Desulfamplus sp.]|nr:acyl carrier protein [Desulfamplus sp.]
MGNKEEIISFLKGFMDKALPSTPIEDYFQIPFLEMGANSLILMQVQQAIENRYRLTIEIPQFFEELTNMEVLVEYIEANISVSINQEEEKEQVKITDQVEMKTSTDQVEMKTSTDQVEMKTSPAVTPISSNKTMIATASPTPQPQVSSVPKQFSFMPKTVDSDLKSSSFTGITGAGDFSLLD